MPISTFAPRLIGVDEVRACDRRGIAWGGARGMALVVANSLGNFIAKQAVASDKSSTPGNAVAKQTVASDVDGTLDFAALQGKRYRKALETKKSREVRANVVIMAISIEPIRCLTKYFLKCGSDVRDPRQPPLAMSLVSPYHSVVVVCMQYLSSLVFDEPTEVGRVMLFCHFFGVM